MARRSRVAARCLAKPGRAARTCDSISVSTSRERAAGSASRYVPWCSRNGRSRSGLTSKSPRYAVGSIDPTDTDKSPRIASTRARSRDGSWAQIVSAVTVTASRSPASTTRMAASAARAIAFRTSDSGAPVTPVNSASAACAPALLNALRRDSCSSVTAFPTWMRSRIVYPRVSAIHASWPRYSSSANCSAWPAKEAPRSDIQRRALENWSDASSGPPTGRFVRLKRTFKSRMWSTSSRIACISRAVGGSGDATMA
jgi:hypothetical protein